MVVGGSGLRHRWRACLHAMPQREIIFLIRTDFFGTPRSGFETAVHKGVTMVHSDEARGCEGTLVHCPRANHKGFEPI
ncbi:hypothetical protein BN2476_1580002 [Paraburkholderia piptadeniae]|uniref:Uncharacterized protein n=1 Tax=Paraburkholderia piptadeniae TaxID=1701573 RepID=A0A1N7SX75_9BURK|nr:hypothetical protein BN2476_1580002 [Paraburkholderia piptadeniae]